ncbi:hypothetical protein K2173_019657 [Erythroxylum novogranatense]|uniref:Bet v I/Major latex protein domain-containing protein n=1 Tax=Erythroxylum novogranatense TaxID=1862640 RepID=A0AAV8UF61_9ROSI|nr:hypothetical protein K2173_019657 [Erythroxylum novogranatense]
MFRTMLPDELVKSLRNNNFRFFPTFTIQRYLQIIIWHYNLNGKAEIFKERTQVDKANKTLTLTALEGDVLRNCKIWKTTFQATPKNETTGYVKIILEYEKTNEDDLVPRQNFDFVKGFAKEVGDPRHD